MNIPAATRIDDAINRRAQRANKATHLKMSDLLRIGLLKVLSEFEQTGTITSGFEPHKKEAAK